jgi:hypothetical protein
MLIFVRVNSERDEFLAELLSSTETIYFNQWSYYLLHSDIRQSLCRSIPSDFEELQNQMLGRSSLTKGCLDEAIHRQYAVIEEQNHLKAFVEEIRKGTKKQGAYS